MNARVQATSCIRGRARNLGSRNCCFISVWSSRGLMKLHTDYDQFHKQLDQIAPVYLENPTLFDDPKDWEVPNALKA